MQPAVVRFRSGLEERRRVINFLHSQNYYNKKLCGNRIIIDGKALYLPVYIAKHEYYCSSPKVSANTVSFDALLLRNYCFLTVF